MITATIYEWQGDENDELEITVTGTWIANEPETFASPRESGHWEDCEVLAPGQLSWDLLTEEQHTDAYHALTAVLLGQEDAQW